MLHMCPGDSIFSTYPTAPSLSSHHMLGKDWLWLNTAITHIHRTVGKEEICEKNKWFSLHKKKNPLQHGETFCLDIQLQKSTVTPVFGLHLPCPIW